MTNLFFTPLLQMNVSKGGLESVGFGVAVALVELFGAINFSYPTGQIGVTLWNEKIALVPIRLHWNICKFAASEVLWIKAEKRITNRKMKAFFTSNPYFWFC